jgi:hypothetical protein
MILNHANEHVSLHTALSNGHGYFARSVLEPIWMEPKVYRNSQANQIRWLIGSSHQECHFLTFGRMVGPVARANAARLLADQGDPAAQLEYGHYSMKGQGFEKSIEEGTEYYKLSADQGDSNDQLYYGNCLEFDKGISLDLSEAAWYFKLSADRGNSDGQNSYALCLEFGKGIFLDLYEDARYFKLSAP